MGEHRCRRLLACLSATEGVARQDLISSLYSAANGARYRWGQLSGQGSRKFEVDCLRLTWLLGDSSQETLWRAFLRAEAWCQQVNTSRIIIFGVQSALGVS